MRAPSSMAVDTSWQIADNARSRARPPPATRYRPLTTYERSPGKRPPSLAWTILASSSLSMIGNGRTSWRQLAALGRSRLSSGPIVDDTDVTTSSRMASSGGLVTWAKSWAK